MGLHDSYILDQRAKWDREQQGLKRSHLSDPPVTGNRQKSPKRKTREPGPPKKPVGVTHSQPGAWNHERTPMMYHSLGYHTSTLGHDELFRHQGPQWVPPPKASFTRGEVGVPKYARPQTQMGVDIRARRRKGEYGLGEAGRQRKQADKLLEEHYPLWGRVGGEKIDFGNGAATAPGGMLVAEEGEFSPRNALPPLDKSPSPRMPTLSPDNFKAPWESAGAASFTPGGAATGQQTRSSKQTTSNTMPGPDSRLGSLAEELQGLAVTTAELAKFRQGEERRAKSKLAKPRDAKKAAMMRNIEARMEELMTIRSGRCQEIMSTMK